MAPKAVRTHFAVSLPIACKCGLDGTQSRSGKHRGQAVGNGDGAAPSGGAAAGDTSTAFGSAGTMGDASAVLKAPVGVLAAPIGARSPSNGPFGAAAASGASVGVAPAGTAADEASESLDCSDRGKGCVALSRLALAFRGNGTVALAASWRNVGSFGGAT